MTLILHIPYKDGCVLVADRKRVRVENGRVVDAWEAKKYHRSPKGFAVVEAGSGEENLALLEKLDASETVTADNIHTILRDEAKARLRNAFMISGKPLKMSFLLATHQTGGTKAYFVEGDICEDVTNRIFGSGAGFSNMPRQLKDIVLVTTAVEVQDIAALGAALIDFEADDESVHVGHVEHFGMDIVTMSQSGVISEQNIAKKAQMKTPLLKTIHEFAVNNKITL